jgi:hypothetical protein
MHVGIGTSIRLGAVGDRRALAVAGHHHLAEGA